VNFVIFLSLFVIQSFRDSCSFVAIVADTLWSVHSFP